MSAQDVTTFVVVGDVMVDTLARIDTPIEWGLDQRAHITRQVGGQAANTSAWLAWLNTSVNLVACHGDDTEGEWVRRSLEEIGVRAQFATVPGATGTCVVVVDADGHRTMFSDPGANAHIARFADARWLTALTDAGDPTHVHLSGYLLDRAPGLASGLLAQARASSARVSTSLDVAAIDPTDDHRADLRNACAYLDVLIATSDEVAALTRSDSPMEGTEGQLIDACRRELAFSGTLVLKRGARGAVVDHGHSRHASPAVAANVVDTTGAGDAFSAGFLAAWTSDREGLAAALGSALGTASKAITRLGAGPPTAEGR